MQQEQGQPPWKVHLQQRPDTRPAPAASAQQARAQEQLTDAMAAIATAGNTEAEQAAERKKAEDAARQVRPAPAGQQPVALAAACWHSRLHAQAGLALLPPPPVTLCAGAQLALQISTTAARSGQLQTG